MSVKPRILLLPAVVVALLTAGLMLAVPTTRHSVLIWGGRNYCSSDAAWRVAPQREVRENLRKKLERDAHIVARDRGLALWSVNGERYWMPASSRVLPGLLADRKTNVYESASQQVRSGDIVLDCGANIGLFTLEALERGASVVVAVEPALDNVECLRKNLAAYIAAGRVIVYPKGVWDKDDVLPLNVQPSNSASYSVALQYRGAKPGPQVELTTIDKLVRELGLQRVDYINMDIEGAEREALMGGARVIRRFKPRMTVSIEHGYDDPREIPEAVRQVFEGYRSSPGRCIETGATLRPAVMSFYAGE